MLRIHLLGQPRLLLDGQPLKFEAPPKTLPLWAYLLLHAERPLGRLSVASALWPDQPEPTARANLRRHLHYLQRALPPSAAGRPWLLLQSNTIQWNPSADFWLDLAEFGRLSADPARLAEAVAVYSGDLLETVHDDWLIAARERLRELYGASLTQLVHQHRSRREYDLAWGYAQTLLARDPLREDIARQAMIVRYEAGDRAGALLEYERFFRVLREELAVEPMPETVALRELIVRNAPLRGAALAPPALEPDPPELRAPRRAASPLPFVGREHELQRLLSVWRRAARSRGGMFLVGGEAGVGKTRLVTELADQVERQGGRVLLGSTVGDAREPYQALRAALTAGLPLLAALELEPVWLAALANLVPELALRRADLPRLSLLDPERERMRLFEALARCLAGLAQPRPVLLILEDMHDTAGATLAAVEFLTRRIGGVPILLVLTYRDTATPRSHPLRELRRRLQPEGLVEHLALAPLSKSAVEALVRQNSAPEADIAGLAGVLYAQTQGYPVLLELLMGLPAQAGPVRIDDQSLPGWGRQAGRVPDPVQAAIEARLARLSPSAQTLAEVAAVIGPAFDVELLCEASGWKEAQALDALGELLDQQLVREAGLRSQFDWAFSHALVRGTLYAAIPPSRRKPRHRRIAHVMEQLHPDRLDELSGQLAVHYDRAGEAAPAVTYYVRAARRALAVFADDEALAYLERGLELGGHSGRRFELLSLREAIYRRRGLRVQQQADLEELARLAQAVPDDEQALDVLQRQVLLQRALGERTAEADLIALFRRRAEAVGLPAWRAAALQAEADHCLLLSQYDQAQPLFERALALRRAQGDLAGEVECCCGLVEVNVQQGLFYRVAPLLKQARALVEQQGNFSLIVQTLRTAANAAFAQQDFPQARALASEMLSLCQTIADREGEADAHARLAGVAARLHQVAEARQHFAEAEARYAGLGKRQGQAAVLVNSSILLLARLGRYAEAEAVLRTAQALFRGLNDLRGQTVCHINLGLAAFLQGHHTLARDEAQRALVMSRTMHNRGLEATALGNLGAAERELGELDQALEHMQTGLELHRALQLPAEIGTDLTDLVITYLRMGQGEAAWTASAEILRLYDHAAGTMVHPQYMLWAAAQAYRAWGDQDGARALLNRARAVLTEKISAIPDEESRAAAAGLPFNREILAAYERDEWPRAFPAPRAGDKQPEP